MYYKPPGHRIRLLSAHSINIRVSRGFWRIGRCQYWYYKPPGQRSLHARLEQQQSFPRILARAHRQVSVLVLLYQ